MGFAEGFNAGSSGMGMALRLGFENQDRERREKREAEEHSLRMGALRRQEQREQEVDTDIGSLRALQGGVYDGRQFDASQFPSVTSDAGPTLPQGAMPAHTRRDASPVELNEGAMRVALSQRRMTDWNALNKDGQDLRMKEARRAEAKRLAGLKDDDLARMFDPVNDNPNAPAMIDFDPKTKKFMWVSRVPGMPSQTLSRAELMQNAMGIWEMGNGDFNAGLQAQIATVQAQRQMQNQGFDRSSKVAGLNADVYFKGRQADNDDQRTRNDGARLGLMRQRHDDGEWKLVGASDDNKGLVQFNERTGKLRVQPLPEGTDAGGLFRKLTGSKGGDAMTKLPEDGTRVRDARGNVLTYTEGEPLMTGGVPPSQRAQTLAKMRLPPQADGLVQWEAGGRFVSVPADNNDVYDLNNKQDVALLRQAIDRATLASTMGRGQPPRYPGGPGQAASLAIERDRNRERQQAYGITR